MLTVRSRGSELTARIGRRIDFRPGLGCSWICGSFNKSRIDIYREPVRLVKLIAGDAQVVDAEVKREGRAGILSHIDERISLERVPLLLELVDIIPARCRNLAESAGQTVRLRCGRNSSI